ncbi:ribosomal protein S18 acetylase RimI-like enzyme [Rhizobium sp. BK181]|uniref:GNAT family N-acetyltransferase n=1 Tax=Rhizobium sp. BK181 TaxID=2587072 RepID=UPI00160D1C49|nr:GNAT family N-acetyltransferase [Rhizobium sp. BK181]MBB3315780.1 ribosomal protein S18 acetylase RimI-like enzyme [Rhizobium sp. BK181]
MTHILDRPIWNALNTKHAGLAEGGLLARRYPPSIVPFAAAADNSPERLEALARLPGAGEAMALAEPGPVAIPDGFDLVGEATLIQMIAKAPHDPVTDLRVAPLTEADAGEMLALAQLTKPGPFTSGAQKLGTFWGVKEDGRLIAMAGQRLRQSGFTELSGLCTHPDYQGRGLGKLLFRYVAGHIASTGATAYLHVNSINTGAIGLYKALGFEQRWELNLRVIKRQD